MMIGGQRIRIILCVALAFIGVTLWGGFQQEQAAKRPMPKAEAQAPQKTETTTSHAHVASDGIPAVSATAIQAPAKNTSKKQDLIRVVTDVLDLQVDLNGGDIVRAELTQYPQAIDTPEEGYVLLSQSEGRNYIAQSGLISPKGPENKETGRATYASERTKYILSEGQDALTVSLRWQHPDGVKITKTYTFKRGEYLIDVAYQVENQTAQPFEGRFYGQLRREFDRSEKKGGVLARQMYQGAALYTPDKPYKKVSFSKMAEQPFKQHIKGGWAAMLEHYFLTAWVPDSELSHDYYTRVDGSDAYNIGALSSFVVKPGQTGKVGARLFIGPELTDTLKEISPGLNLTVDYGILWPISQLIFWVLKNVFSFLGNWGWSIIAVTFLIKLAFYKLSAASYRSMGKMRSLQPKLQTIKARCGDDKQKLSQETMALYKKEKVNPLGGCLPILIQIPVFIALYYVLLESVELRQAPFILWINDLASKDPFYVLPLLMGISMFIQQKLNPAPPDPTQAKVMMLMPVIFTVMFLTFPAGLVLYWVANNVLSILQQWYITRKIAMVPA